VSARTAGPRTWRAGMVVALGLLLSLYGLSPRPPKAMAQHPGPGGIFLDPLEDATGRGRVAVLALTLNPRVRIVAGSLVVVRVGTKAQRPRIGTATHCHTPPYAIAGWIETSCLRPGPYVLHATMRGAQGEVDTATLSVTVPPVSHMGRAPCRVTQAVMPLPGEGTAWG
jgi:hypothetical protein